MAITKNLTKVKAFCKELREDCINMIKKNLDIEDLLDEPEATMVIGQTLEIYDKAVVMMEDQAKQLDEMAEMIENSYKMISKMNETINDLRKEMNGAH